MGEREERFAAARDASEASAWREVASLFALVPSFPLLFLPLILRSLSRSRTPVAAVAYMLGAVSSDGRRPNGSSTHPIPTSA